MRWFLLVVLALGACRSGFLPGGDDTQPIDASVVDSRGDALDLGPFSVPVPISELNLPGEQDDDPTLTEDLLEIYFDSTRASAGAAYGDAWVATRAAVTDPFGMPAIVTPLVSLEDDSTFDLSPDGLRMYFGSDRLIATNRDLYVSTRADRVSAWSAPVRIDELASNMEDSGACETADGLTLIFASTRSGSGDLYVAIRPTKTSTWGLPVKIDELSTPYEESQHWCNHDATVMYFSRRDPLDMRLDVWRASRPTPTAAWENIESVPELNVPDVDDADPWLSPDQRTIIFYSDRVGLGDIYIATR